MTARNIIDHAGIAEVWAALGGGPLHHGRGKAFWRDGDGHNIAVNEPKNVFYDHARGVGGGVLDLVETVLGCEPRAALRWLANHLGIRLDDRPLTSAERRKYTQRRAQAQVAARNLTDWRRRVLRELRDERNRLFLSEHMVSAVARTLLAPEGGGDDDEDTWAEVWRCAPDDLKANAIDCEIQRIENAPPAELIAMRRASELGRQVA